MTQSLTWMTVDIGTRAQRRSPKRRIKGGKINTSFKTVVFEKIG